MGGLNDIQRRLKAPKSNFNSSGKYNYRSCEDILEAVKPLLGESTLLLSDEVVEIGGRIYVKATATFNDGKTETKVSAYAREEESKKGMDASQVTGTASSYARKYALNGLFLIDDTKDADTDEYAKATRKDRKEKETVRHELEQKLRSLMTDEEWNKTIEKNGDPDTWSSENLKKWTEALERRNSNV